MIRLLLLLCLWTGAIPQAHASSLVQDDLRLDAPGLAEAPLRIRVYLPPGYAATQARYTVLYVNDGQDMEAVDLAGTLQRLYARDVITRIIVVAVDMPPDRMAGYGLFDREKGEAITAPTKHGVVGANAQAYASWLTQVLVPAIDARYRTQANVDGRTILGWSLGALSAFGIGWQYPETFGRVGAFSPSFWLAADPADAASVQATRIVHRLVDASPPASRPRVFLGVGTQEESDDRDGDGDGMIDVVDDALELIAGQAGVDGITRGGLAGLGIEANLDGARSPTCAAATLYLLEGGRHQQSSWARMLPPFLRWAFAPAPTRLGC